MKVWVWYRCQKWTEKHYHYDGEQLTSVEKYYISKHMQRKEECDCNFCIAMDSKCRERSWLRWIVIKQVNHK